MIRLLAPFKNKKTITPSVSEPTPETLVAQPATISIAPEFQKIEKVRDEAVLAAISGAENGLTKLLSCIHEAWAQHISPLYVALQSYQEELEHLQKNTLDTQANITECQNRIIALKEEIAGFASYKQDLKHLAILLVKSLMLLTLCFFPIHHYVSAYDWGVSPIFVGLCFLLLGSTNLFNRSSFWYENHDTQEVPPAKWRIWLEEAMQPVAVALGVVLWHYQAHALPHNIGMFILMLVIFWFPGRMMLSYMRRLFGELRNVSSLDAQFRKQRETLVQQEKQLAELLEKHKAEQQSIRPLQEKITARTADIKRLEKERDTLTATATHEYEFAIASLGLLSKNEVEELAYYHY